MTTRFEVQIVHNVRIPSPDGSLAADLFLPFAAGPVPAIVTLQPYRKDVLGGAGCFDLMRTFAAHGYAGVVVDIRGHGSSDGVARAPFDPAEADDGVAAVEWAAAQRWCSGPVGMWGFSYGAALALRTASRRPAPLRAVVSAMGLTEPAGDFIHPGGARGCLGPLGIWGLGDLVNHLLPPLLDYHEPDEQQRWLRRVEQVDPYLADLYRHGPGDPVWSDRAIDPVAIATPTLCVGGWRDAFADATLRLYEQLGAPARLVMGPWAHTLPSDATDEPVDFPRLALDWFGRWLSGDRPPDRCDEDAPVLVHVQGPAGGWRRMATWPPPALLHRSTVDGMFTGPSSTVDGSRIALPSDPTAGTLSGFWGIPNGAFPTPVDQHDDDTRSAAFTSAPLTEPLLLAGRPAVSLTLAGGGPRLIVKLTNVDPDGRSLLIAGGIAVAPGPAGPIEVVLDPTAYRLAAGHRLRVVVSAAAFPRLWPVDAAPEAYVRRLALHLPTVATDVGDPAEPPRPPAAPPGAGWASETPEWEVTRDLARPRVTVVVGDTLRATLPASRHRLVQQTRLSAAVSSAAPGAATLRGHSSTTVDLVTGERVEVRVELVASEEAASAIGEVRVDGSVVVTRQWHLLAPAVPPGDQAGDDQQPERGDEHGVVAGQRVAAAAVAAPA